MVSWHKYLSLQELRSVDSEKYRISILVVIDRFFCSGSVFAIITIIQNNAKAALTLNESVHDEGHQRLSEAQIYAQPSGQYTRPAL